MSTPTTFKERPILFSGPMVRALLAGTKTQTRRTRDLDWVNKWPDQWSPEMATDLTTARDAWWRFVDRRGLSLPCDIRCPYGQPGDRLWVRETLSRHGDFAIYRADGADVRHELATHAVVAGDPCDALGRPWQQTWGWKHDALPSIHMPRWASRISLEITDVRVQRLNDISEADAIAEGIVPGLDDEGWQVYGDRSGIDCSDPELAFRDLWESINGAGSWDANPWVWAISFKRAAP